MRIRSIKPIFWRDRELARAGDEARLFYIGLWMQADDGGYFRWNADEIAADLYPFLSERARLRKLDKCLSALQAMAGDARLVIGACGHAQLTRFLDHQKSGMPGESKRVYTYQLQHEKCILAAYREPPREPANPRERWDGTIDGTKDKGRDGTRADAREGGSKDPSNEDELRRRLADPSTPAAIREGIEATLARRQEARPN